METEGVTQRDRIYNIIIYGSLFFLIKLLISDVSFECMQHIIGGNIGLLGTALGARSHNGFNSGEQPGDYCFVARASPVHNTQLHLEQN